MFTFGERIVVIRKREFSGLLFCVVLLLLLVARDFLLDFVAMAPRRLVRAGVVAANIATEVAIAGVCGGGGGRGG